MSIWVDFWHFVAYFQTHIEKGNDLLEEASMLAQSGNFDEVTGYKELARMLKTHLHKFTSHLEDTRERLESTTKCYHLLDKVCLVDDNRSVVKNAAVAQR